MLETQETRNADVERPHYMPLFVAPQPIPEPLADDEDVDDGPDYVADDSDADDEGQLDRPANRRRRRGRRGRGRGRGEQGGSDGDPVDQQSEPRAQQFTSADAAETDDGDDRDSEDTEAGDNGEDENGSLEAGNRRRRRRRRRKSASGDDNDAALEGPLPDDPPNTVVHERVPARVTRPATRRMAALAPLRSRASTARPAWKPSGNAAATGATPAGAAHRC